MMKPINKSQKLTEINFNYARKKKKPTTAKTLLNVSNTHNEKQKFNIC